MGDRAASLVFKPGKKPRCRDGAGIRGNQGVFPDDRFNLGKNPVFQVQVFGGCFNNPVTVRKRRVIRARTQVLHDVGRPFCRQLASLHALARIGLDTRKRLVQLVFHDIDQHQRQSGDCAFQVITDIRADGAGTDDPDRPGHRLRRSVDQWIVVAFHFAITPAVSNSSSCSVPYPISARTRRVSSPYLGGNESSLFAPDSSTGMGCMRISWPSGAIVVVSLPCKALRSRTSGTELMIACAIVASRRWLTSSLVLISAVTAPISRYISCNSCIRPLLVARWSLATFPKAGISVRRFHCTSLPMAI